MLNKHEWVVQGVDNDKYLACFNCGEVKEYGEESPCNPPTPSKEKPAEKECKHEYENHKESCPCRHSHFEEDKEVFYPCTCHQAKGQDLSKILPERTETKEDFYKAIEGKNTPEKTKLDYKKMVQDIDKLVNNDWSYEMGLKQLNNLPRYTQKEAEKMAQVIGQAYLISHCLTCKACWNKYKIK